MLRQVGGGFVAVRSRARWCGVAAAVTVALAAGADRAAAAPCDARPGTLGGATVWVLPTGEDLQFGDPGQAVVRGTDRGDELTVGAVYRNCHPGAIAVGQTEYYSKLGLQLHGLGRAFRFERVVDDGGLGRPVRHGSLLTWGDRVLTLPAGTQAMFTIRVRAIRPGTFELDAFDALALSPTGPFDGRGVKFGRQYVVSRHRRPPVRVQVKTCLSSEARIVAGPPSARVRRPGGRRVRLRRRRQVCVRERLRGARALRWQALPPVPVSGQATPPPLADCLLSADAEPLGLNGFLLSRADWCAPPAQLAVRVVVTRGGRDVPVGVGELSLSRRIDWSRNTSNGRYDLDVSYTGVDGVIEAGAFFRFHLFCEGAFGARCAGRPRGSPVRAMGTGTSAHLEYDVLPSAIPGDSTEFVQPWLEARVAPTASALNLPNAEPIAIGGPRARCDTRGPGQRCVWADFNPTLSFAAARLPEIVAHIRRAQAAGQPGSRQSGHPLQRLTGPEVNRNRRAACPRALVRRFRRERPDGSCDEYPFASTDEGGHGSSVANVALRENNVQGGLVRAFYDRERIIRDDSYWVATTP